MRLYRRAIPALALLLLVSGCSRWSRVSKSSQGPDPCRIVLTPQEGSDRLQPQIARAQEQAERLPNPIPALERLGWLFVAKSRVTSDPGYYKLAEQCAECIESKRPGSLEALLLRGHVLHNLHRFKEAEKIARKLVSMRESAFDHGLLGDVLMEQGRLAEAADAYQKMMDLKPSLQAYSRAAHLRWLKGDLSGAIEMMTMAARAGSPRDSESVAWVYTRLALYHLQAGEIRSAALACDAALDYEKDYAPALLARGRVLLARGEPTKAVEPLRRAIERNPLPEYAWVLADALEAAGRSQEAQAVEAELRKHGAVSDPRTFSLYLATRRQDIETALRLAQEELETRADAFTLDAFAWSLAAAGKAGEAKAAIERALSSGTQDARLFYHAGVIASASGSRTEARVWFRKAAAIQQMLLPSEREQLGRELALM